MKTLVVEDDFLSRSLLSNLFSGYGVCHAAVNGEEAVAAYEKTIDDGAPYDLICLDIMMPVMDGQQTLARIRDIEERRGIDAGAGVRVIMVSAVDDARNVAKAFNQGKCEAYHTKPIDRDKLLGQVRELGLSI